MGMDRAAFSRTHHPAGFMHRAGAGWQYAIEGIDHVQHPPLTRCVHLGDHCRLLDNAAAASRPHPAACLETRCQGGAGIRHPPALIFLGQPFLESWNSPPQAGFFFPAARASFSRCNSMKAGSNDMRFSVDDFSSSTRQTGVTSVTFAPRSRASFTASASWRR